MRSFKFLKKLLIFPLVIAISALLNSCSSPQSASETPSQSEEIIPKIAENTVVLDENATKAIENVDRGKKEIVLKEEVAKNIKKDSIIVLPKSDKTPFGMLVKVESVEKLPDGKVKISYRSATLTEAIERGQIKATNVQLSADNIYRVILNGDTEFSTEKRVSTSSFKDGPITLSSQNGDSIKIYPTATDVITFNISGSLGTEVARIESNAGLSLSYDFDMVINDFQMEKFHFKTKSQFYQITKAYVKAGFKGTYEKKLGSIWFNPIVIVVGDVPVLIFPAIEFYVGVTGSAQGEILTKLENAVSFISGLKYENRKWQPIKEYQQGSSFSPPAITEAKAGARGYVKAQTVLYVYGVAGPYSGLNGYIDMSVDPLKEPWCNISLGVGIYVGAKMQIFGRTLSDVSYDLYDISKPLYECKNIGAPALKVTPTAGITVKRHPSGSFNETYSFSLSALRGNVKYSVYSDTPWIYLEGNTSGEISPSESPERVNILFDENYIKSQPAGTTLEGEVCFKNITNNIGTHCKPINIILKPDFSITLIDHRIADIKEGEDPPINTGSSIDISYNSQSGYPLRWEVVSKPSWISMDATSGVVNPGENQSIPIHPNLDALKYASVGRHGDWIVINYNIGDYTGRKLFFIDYFVHLNISNGSISIDMPVGGPILFPTTYTSRISSFNGKIEWVYEGVLKWSCTKTAIAWYLLDCKLKGVEDSKRWISVDISKGGTLNPDDYYEFNVSLTNIPYLLQLPVGHRETLCVHISSSDDYGFHREDWSDYVDGPCFSIEVHEQFEVIGGDTSFTVDSSGNSIPSSYNYIVTAEHLGTTFSVETDVSWLDISPSTGNVSKNNPATVSISPNSTAANLQAGTYNGKIYFKDPHGNVIATKNVTLRVTAPASNNLCTLPPTPMDDNLEGIFFDFNGTNCSFSTNNGIINFFIASFTTGTFTVVSWIDNGTVTGISPVEDLGTDGDVLGGGGICLNTDVLVNVNYNGNTYQGIFRFNVDNSILPQGSATANCPNGLFLDATTISPSDISVELKSWKKIN
ncbi:BACON domain-containing protein [Persephonella sp.]